MTSTRVLLAGPLTVAIALVAGLVATSSAASPTGRSAPDAVIVGVAVGAMVFMAGRCRWWVLAAAAGAALAIAVDPLLAVLAATGLGVSVWVGVSRREQAALLTVSAAISANVLARAELDGFLGLSTIVAVGVGAAVFVAGARRHSRRVRRLAWSTVGVLTVLGVVATAGFGLAAVRSRDDLADGVRWAEEGVTKLENGEFAAAADSFEAAAEALGRAREQLGGPMALAASVVPFVAQHRSAAVDMSGAGANGAAILATALDEIDLQRLRAVGGSFDLDVLAALQQPLGRVRWAMSELSAAASRSLRSPWLVNGAVVELEDFRVMIDEHLPDLDDAIEAVELAPGMLGAERPRTYLLLFTTPAEARGLGGFVGSYAELSVDDGHMALGAFGRAQDLDAMAAAARATVSGPAEFLTRYRRFGFDEDGTGRVGDASFRNLTVTPNFPWIGSIAAEIYQETTGRAVDGVLVLDPYVVARFLDYTGPVRLASLDRELTSATAAQFLLRDQYVIGADDNIERTEALAEAARLTFEALIDGALPEPITLARDLGPLASERRVMMWSADAAEQELLERVDVAGAIPPLDGRDGWSFAVTNAGSSKIDTFLERRAAYLSTIDSETGQVTSQLRVELTNTAPAEGLPPYVIGNGVGLPEGTSRLYVSFYSALGLTDMTLDGRPSGVEAGVEAGWNVYSRFVDIPPGGHVTFKLDLEGAVDRPDEIVTWEQPLNTPVELLE